MSDKLVSKKSNELLGKNGDRLISAKFKPQARLLIQLGDQLIKNESIALVELVKNSYDADARVVNILMEKIDDPDSGIIVVEDDGFGMDLDIVENVWLEPGSDFKSKQFERNEISPKYNRLPIGEKGIGRFGVHKLGKVIEMTTRMKNSKEIFVRINWADFDDYKYLDEVPITIIEREKPRLFKGKKTGTSITVSKLRKKWERGTTRNVKRSITALASPFKSIDSFETNFELVDKQDWFKGLLSWKDIKEFSLFYYKITVTGNSIRKFEYKFTPWASMSKLSGREISYRKSESKSPSLKGVDESEQRLVEVFSDINDEKEKFSLKQHKIGEIVFEGYIFDRDNFVLQLGVSDKTGFKKYLKNNSGIMVFRDDMRVYDYGEPENDWLGLDLRRVNQPGKKISRNIVLGAIYLKREDSSDLIEKTNREGFTENGAYKAFKRTCLYLIDLVENFRFTDKLKLREAYGPTRKSEPIMQLLGELKGYVDTNVKETKARKTISKYLTKIEKDYTRIRETLLMSAGAGLSLSVVIHEMEKIIGELERVVDKDNISDRVTKLVIHLSSLIDGYAEIIKKSSQTTQDARDIIDQALFNTEYRLNLHKVKVIKGYKRFTGNAEIKTARNLLLSSIMNIIDNSIYWLEKAHNLNSSISKKIYIDISDEGGYLDIVIADNGTGFLLSTKDIIEPFVSAKSGGIGLGLHITNEVMLAQKGRLVFPDKGDYEIPDEFENGAVLALSLKKSK